MPNRALKLKLLEAAKVIRTPGELKLIQLHGLRAIKSANDNATSKRKV